MNRPMLNRILIGAALCATGFLAACEQPYNEPEPVEAPAPVEADSAEDAAAPVVAETPAAPAPVTPVEALPPDHRSSEQTVQPESDTLFY